MNNTGSDSAGDVDSVTSLPENRRVPTKIIVLGAFAVIFALVVGSQVIGILYAIFFPPATPIPDQSTVVSHSSKDYGVDDWLYTSKLSACDVMHFYEQKDGVCRVAPVWCSEDSTSQSTPAGANTTGQNVARCVGTQQFSIFALRWEVVIATGATADQATQFRIGREIFWTGAVPPYTPPSLDGGFSQSLGSGDPPTKAS